MRETGRLTLIVASGPGPKSQLIVDGRPRTVGRAVDADLVLADPTVSRRHAEVSTTSAGRLRVRVCPGAAEILHGERPVLECEAAPGDRLVIGSSVLVVEVTAEAPAGGPHVTEAATLLSGLAADVHGLAAIFALIGALDGARDLETTRAEIAAWAARSMGAVDVTLAPAELARAEGGGGLVIEAATSADRALVRATLDTAVSAELRVTLPVAPERVSESTQRLLVVAARLCGSALERIRALGICESDNATLRQRAIGSARAILGDSPAAQEIARLVPRLASSDVIALLTGETGTGKTFVARLLHDVGPRASEPFYVVNCAAIPESLIESELFGHERGAFTGALVTRAGAFEAAGRGTLFLDEIGELPLASQAKLLRVLEERRFERIGSTRSLSVHARVIVATNRDLAEMVRAGTFRSDLFFRINVIRAHVPPLRERGGDIVLLAEQILSDLLPSAGRRVSGFTREAVAALRAYSWPGNVRELRNVIERAVVLGDSSTVDVADLPDVMSGVPSESVAAVWDADPDVVRLPASLKGIEARAIAAALRATGGNQTRAAALLGIGRVTLYKKLRDEVA